MKGKLFVWWSMFIIGGLMVMYSCATIEQMLSGPQYGPNYDPTLQHSNYSDAP